ncbi:hypothetical protein GQR86_03370, partial [Providencia vermicola]|nr:hypothetical protein [Providencia vermicola]
MLSNNEASPCWKKIVIANRGGNRTTYFCVPVKELGIKN